MLENYNIYDLREEALKQLNKLAYPPKNLPSRLSYKSTEENPVDLDAKIAEYAPYYEYTKTIETKYKYDKSGAVQKEKVETLQMKLINPEPYRKILKKYEN